MRNFAAEIDDLTYLIQIQRNMSDIIGRERETKELMRLYRKKQALLVAVYGRRRVGKTYLIRELFKDCFAFYHTGVANAPKKEQLGEVLKVQKKILQNLKIF